MHTARITELYPNGRRGRWAGTTRATHSAQGLPMSRWQRAKATWATFIALVREGRALADELRAEAGYTGFRED